MLIPRKDVLARVSSVITPEPSPIGYGLISGSHGSGKSTACYHAARAIGQGIVLFGAKFPLTWMNTLQKSLVIP
jgi:hypothetical protein